MATQAQIDANRRNALKSTGPRSPEGKAVSRWNALRTGIQARSVVIPGEDPAELERLTLDYHRQFQPFGPAENFLVDSMVMAEWRLRRYRKVEPQLWTDGFMDNPALARFHRRIDAAERSFHRALRELRRLQSERQAQDDQADPAELASFGALPDEPPACVPASAPLALVAAPSAGPSGNLALRL